MPTNQSWIITKKISWSFVYICGAAYLFNGMKECLPNQSQLLINYTKILVYHLVYLPRERCQLKYANLNKEHLLSTSTLCTSNKMFPQFTEPSESTVKVWQCVTKRDSLLLNFSSDVSPPSGLPRRRILSLKNSREWWRTPRRRTTGEGAGSESSPLRTRGKSVCWEMASF